MRCCRGKVEDAFPIEGREGVRHQKERVGALPDHRGKGPVEVIGFSHAERLDGHPQDTGRLLGLPVAERHRAIVRIPEHGDARGLRHRLLEKLQALRTQLGRLIRDPGDVPAGPGQARDEPGAHRITGPGVGPCWAPLGPVRGQNTDQISEKTTTPRAPPLGAQLPGIHS